MSNNDRADNLQLCGHCEQWQGTPATQWNQTPLPQNQAQVAQFHNSAACVSDDRS